MKSAKNFLMVAGAFSLAIILFAVAAPRTAHAIVATLVQITNTASNPVPVDADNSARHAVRLGAFGTTDHQNGFLGTQFVDLSNNQVFTVPAGKRLVIEHASVFTNTGAAVFSFWSNGFGFTGLTVPANAFQASISTRDYVDAGHQIDFTVFAGPDDSINLFVVGYLIDCNGLC